MVATNSLIGVADAGFTLPPGANNRTGTAASPLDPLLGPLAGNGGPTATTCRPPTARRSTPAPTRPRRHRPAGSRVPAGRRRGRRHRGGRDDRHRPGATGGPFADVTPATPHPNPYQFTVTYTDESAVGSRRSTRRRDRDRARTARSTGTRSVNVRRTATPAATVTYQFTAARRVVGPGGQRHLHDRRASRPGDRHATTRPSGRTARLVPRPARRRRIIVTNTNDSGPGSLREAVLDANALAGTAGHDRVQHRPGSTGTDFDDATPDTITLTSELSMTDAVTITGPGAATC